MSRNNNGKISIANIIAMIGLAGIGVITFLGLLLHSSDAGSTMSILGSIALVAVLGFLLFMSIKAKGAEENLDIWRYVEWASVLLYVLVAILFSSPFLRFFYVIGEKETMQTQAKKEANAIESLYNYYDHEREKNINDAVEQMKNYFDRGQHKFINNDQLAQYMKKYSISSSATIDIWAFNARDKSKLKEDAEFKKIKEQIEVWNYMQLSELSLKLKDKGFSAWKSVADKIEKMRDESDLIPVIAGGGSQPYSLDGYAKFELGDKPKAKFSEMLMNANGSTMMGWIIYAVLNLLVLLNYAVAYRSEFVRPRRTGGSGRGLEL